MDKSIKGNLNTIDVFKLFCAILVIGIHTEPFSQYGMLDNAFGLLTRIAVPFFFVASAYFFFRKDVTMKSLWKYAKRILILYVFYSVIYVVFDMVSGEFVFTDFLFSFFLTGYKHLWFLHSSLIAIIVLYFLSRKEYIFKISVVFVGITYIFALLLFTYNTIVKDVAFFSIILDSSFVKVFYERSWLFYALPYMMIGYLIAKTKSIKINLSLISTIIFFVLLGIEGAVCILKIGTESTILWMFTLPLSFFIFQFVLNVNLFKNMNTRWCRSISTIMYCIHPLIIRILSVFNISNNLLLFVIVTLISMAISYGLFLLSNIERLKVLKYIQ